MLLSLVKASYNKKKMFTSRLFENIGVPPPNISVLSHVLMIMSEN